LSGTVVLREKWSVIGRHEQAATWLQMWTDLGWAPRTIDAYARGLAEYLVVCEREGVDPVTANRAHVAVFVRELTSRPHHRGANVVAIDSGAGLAKATMQQRLVPVRLFYGFLMEEGLRESNPVGRGRYTPGGRAGGAQRGLVPRLATLPWFPGEQEWLRLLEEARGEPARNRLMLALAYDAALRREELCSLRTDDVDPAHRRLRVRAETTKNRLERVVPYSASSGLPIWSFSPAVRWRYSPTFIRWTAATQAAQVRGGKHCQASPRFGGLGHECGAGSSGALDPVRLETSSWPGMWRKATLMWRCMRLEWARLHMTAERKSRRGPGQRVPMVP
jgi:site-specific recombinase XerD